jgi:hypothetical protein
VAVAVRNVRVPRVTARVAGRNVAVRTAGFAGPPGPAGPGVPAGGPTGYFLAKRTVADFDTQWVAFVPPASVTSFNTRTGDVVLASADVTTALGYSDVARKGQVNTFTAAQVLYPSLSTAVPLTLKSDGSGPLVQGFNGSGVGVYTFYSDGRGVFGSTPIYDTTRSMIVGNGASGFVDYNGYYNGSVTQYVYQGCGGWHVLGAKKPDALVVTLGGITAGQWTGTALYGSGLNCLEVSGTGAVAKAGFLGAAPVARQALAAAAVDLASAITLANSIRTALVNLGLGT